MAGEAPKLHASVHPDLQSQEAYGRQGFRSAINQKLLPALRAFRPDLILVSAGFDGSKNDVGNSRHAQRGGQGGMDLISADFEWVASRLASVAALCCEGRMVAVLEGGYGRCGSGNSLNLQDLSNNCSSFVHGMMGLRKKPSGRTGGLGAVPKGTSSTTSSLQGSPVPSEGTQSPEKRDRSGSGTSAADEEMYLIDRIMKARTLKDGTKEFRIRWQGYGPSDDTWEPEAGLRRDCPDALQEFIVKNKKAGGSTKPTTPQRLRKTPSPSDSSGSNWSTGRSAPASKKNRSMLPPPPSPRLKSLQKPVVVAGGAGDSMLAVTPTASSSSSSTTRNCRT